MQITTSKSAIAEALAPFSKLGVENFNIAVLRGSVSMSAKTPLSRLLTTPDGFTAEGDGSFSVSLKSLKEACASSPRQEIVLRHDGKSLLNIGDSTGPGINIVAQPCSMPQITVAEGASRATLSTGFCGYLLQAMQAASTDESRQNINGVLVSKEGLVGTDGRQLMVLRLPMPSISESVTLPVSPVYAALRKLRWLNLFTWKEEGDQWACIEGIGFRLILRAVRQAYPNYSSVIPPCSSLDTSVVFDEDCLDQLRAFLKGLAKNDNELEIQTAEFRIDIHSGDRFVSMPGKCTGASNAVVHCKAEYLLRALSYGHTGFRFNSKAHMPIVATGAPSTYLWMPMSGGPVRSAVPKSDTAGEDACKTDASVSVKPVAVAEPQLHKSTSSAKEPTTMATATIPSVPAVYRPAVQAASTENSASGVPVPSDPMADLATAVNDMRSQIDTLQTRLLEVGRKLKEAAVAQRQKERVYLEATRKLDRIRLAM